MAMNQLTKRTQANAMVPRPLPGKEFDETDIRSCASFSTASNVTPEIEVTEWEVGTNTAADDSTSVASMSASMAMSGEWRQAGLERTCSGVSSWADASEDDWAELDPAEEVISKSTQPAVWRGAPERRFHAVGNTASSAPLPGALDRSASTTTPEVRYTVKNTFIDVEEVPSMVRARRMSAPAALSRSQVLKLELHVPTKAELLASVGDAPAEVADMVARRAALAKMAATHEAKQCVPCSYFWFKDDGCRQGELCRFCHFCTKGEIRKLKKTRAKQQRRLQAQALGEQEVVEASDA